ncbi:MAG: NUDIX domain-containing protein [Ignavibacteria bacterium]|nr:NUDIX domain-containing protein [Ignavibacteria bacterium]MCC7158117.1 NUDIX domain-containing protein [Ignavibacteria bacterium]
MYAMLIYGNKYILIKKSKGPFKGRWDLPGGKMDFGESPEEALEREIMEETGLRVRSKKLQTVISYVHETAKEIFHHTAVIFSCEAKDVKKLKREPDGNDSFGAEIFTLKKIGALKLTPIAKKAMKIVGK